MTKKTAAVFLALAVCMVLFFTFQEPGQSKTLSEAVRMWLEEIGITVEYKELRSNIHILEYFIVGLAVCGVVRRNWVRIVIGCGIGVIDEGIKVLLPGREFEKWDLFKDWAGIIVALLIVSLRMLVAGADERRRRKDKNDIDT